MNLGLFLMWLFIFSGWTFIVMDALDLPFMEIFDTVIPLNGLFYFLILAIFLISIAEIKELNDYFNGK